MESTPEQQIRFLKELNDMKENRIKELEETILKLNRRCNELQSEIIELKHEYVYVDFNDQDY